MTDELKPCPLTWAIQRLNSTPYSLTKDECVDVLRGLRDEIRALTTSQPAQTDSMGMPTSCGKPLCSPDEHHPLCKLHKPAAQATPEPVADSIEHLRVIASLGVALRRLSFAAQTSGGTAGPDAELQAAIGQAEQALSFGGIAQAMFATPEPVGCVWIQPDHLQKARVAPHLCRVAPTRLAPDFVPLSTHPAPGVPDVDIEQLRASA